MLDTQYNAAFDSGAYNGSYNQYVQDFRNWVVSNDSYAEIADQVGISEDDLRGMLSDD